MGRSAPPQRTERSEVQAASDEKASRWRQEFEDRDDEVGERKDLASRWQQYSETAQEHMFCSAMMAETEKNAPNVPIYWCESFGPVLVLGACMHRASKLLDKT